MIATAVALAGCSSDGGADSESAFTSQSISDAAAKAAHNLVSRQDSDGKWQGALEGDPSIDVLWLVLGKRLGMNVDGRVEGLKKRLALWRGNHPAWGSSPTSDPSVDITGTILLGTSELGIEKSDPTVSDAWNWLDSAGGTGEISQLSQVLLYGVELSTLFNPVGPRESFAAPRLSPFNVYDVGIFRGMLVPLEVMSYYRGLTKQGRQATALDPKRVESAGALFTNVAHVLESEEFWAQEGLGWILAHQQSDGPWYTFQMSLFSLMALKAAHDAGVADFGEQIARGWKGLEGWVGHDAKLGTDFVMPSRSAGWDTPFSIRALMDLPKALQTEETKAAVTKAAKWIIQTQIRDAKVGDWRYLVPDLPPGAWSFVTENPYYPDTDVSAASIDALLDARAHGIEPEGLTEAACVGARWLVGMQNTDGGWGAWDKGIPHSLDLLSQWFGHVQMIDVSQADVTARISRMLVKLQDSKLCPELDTATAIRDACNFMVSQSDGSDASKWRGDWFAAYVYGTAEVTSGLLTTGCWAPKDAAGSIEWILGTQNADGGWGESLASYDKGAFDPGPSTTDQTHYPMVTLLKFAALARESPDVDQGLRARVDSAIDRGAAYLVKRMGAQGEFYERDYIGVMIKGRWSINYELAPQYGSSIVFGNFLAQK